MCRGEAGLLRLLDLAPVSVKLSDTKSWYQIFLRVQDSTLCIVVLTVKLSYKTSLKNTN